MRRRLLGVAVVAGAALGALPAAASGAPVPILGLDDGGQTRFSPPDVTARPGDTAQWSFGQATVPHNVFVVAPGVEPANTAAHEALGIALPAAPQPLTRALDAKGVYLYYCSFHGSLAPGGMNGRVVVADEGDAPPPPPLPTGPAAQPNTTVFGAVFEEGDVVAPVLTKVGVLRNGRALRIRYQLSEPAAVTVRIVRKRKTVKSAVFPRRKAGVGTVTLKGGRRLRPGRYMVSVVASDAAKLSSRAPTRKLTISR
jgi:plastocyanin